MMSIVTVWHYCQFPNCEKKYKEFYELVQHVEATHLDFSPEYQDQLAGSKPTMVPMSYILRMFPPEDEEEAADVDSDSPPPLLGPASFIVSSEIPDDQLPSGKDVETDSSPSLPKIDAASKTTPLPKAAAVSKASTSDTSDIRLKNMFRCHCGKSYKTAHGLKNHAVTHNSILTVSSPVSKEGDIVSGGSSKTTLALLIQAQNITDTEVLTKLANGTLTVRDSTSTLPFPGNKTYIPVELSSSTADQTSKIVFQPTVSTTSVQTTASNTSTDTSSSPCTNDESLKKSESSNSAKVLHSNGSNGNSAMESSS